MLTNDTAIAGNGADTGGSITNLADRLPPRRLIFLGASGAAAANAIVVVGDSYTVAIIARLATGAFLAGVYPPSLKAMSAWYRAGRALRLGPKAVVEPESERAWVSPFF